MECNNNEISFEGPRGRIVLESMIYHYERRPTLEMPCVARTVVCPSKPLACQNRLCLSKPSAQQTKPVMLFPHPSQRQ